MFLELRTKQIAELVFGAENSSKPKKNFQLIESFSEQVIILPLFNAVHFYAKEKVRLRKKGEMISDFDLLIGCTALTNGLIIVTENVKEFSRISELEVENWVVR